MDGNKLRETRKKRAWSQRHLADVAGVSIRTVQRAERTGICSDDSALRLSSALDVDVQVLTSAPGEISSAQSRTVIRILGGEIPSRTATITGGLLTLPSAVFVGANLLKFEAGYPWLYDVIASVGESVPFLRSIGTSPVVLAGFPVAAILLVLSSQIRILGDADKDTRRVSIFGVEMHVNRAGLAVAGLAALCLAVLGGYLLFENLGHYLSELAQRG